MSKNVSKYLQTNKPTDKFTKDVVWTKQGATDRIEKYQWASKDINDNHMIKFANLGELQRLLYANI